MTNNNKPTTTDLLPIHNVIPEICAALTAHHNVVLSAEPGAGKSTAVPLALLNQKWLGQRKIMMLQPRRIAAKSIAHYLAKYLGERVGETIGYQVRHENRVSKASKLVIVTEGILTRKMQQDPELSDVALIIFDEFHERSIHGDLGLMFSAEIQQSLREDLRLLVMSATVDTKLVSDYLEDVVTVSCPGRTFPVDISHQPPDKSSTNLQSGVSRLLAFSVLKAVKALLAKPDTRDILVFLPGQGEIKRCIEVVQEQLSVNSEEDRTPHLVPLYGALSLQEQQKALLPDDTGRQKIIFSTNIAETSLTVEGISAVIDSGLEKRIQFDPASGLNRLVTGWIAKSSAQQRSGRAGRLGPGSCIRLWSEEQEKQFIAFQHPEIESTDLSSLIMQLSVWGSPDYASTNWLSQPKKAHYDQARELLQRLDLIDESAKLTATGRLAANLPLTPRLAKMLVCAGKSVTLACWLASLLDVRDILVNADSVDLHLRINVLETFLTQRQRAVGRQGINHALLHQVKTQVSALHRQVSDSPGVTDKNASHSAAELLLMAFPDRLAKQRPGSPHRYILANGKGVSLQEHDPLTAHQWLVVTDCDIKARDGRIFAAIGINETEIRAVLESQLTTVEVVGPDKQQRLCVKSITRYQQIDIDEEVSYQISKEHRQCYLEDYLLEKGLDCLNWNSRCETWLRRASWLGQYSDEFPQLNETTLTQSIRDWLLPYIAELQDPKELPKVDVYPLLKAVLNWEQQQELAAHAPEFYQAPSGKQVKIIYDLQQGPIVSLQLQEVFGELQSPLLGFGKVPLRFELLSPARRPIQTTSDLAGFWRTSYFDVAKEMRGRYPKHRWPEEPLIEKAGRSIKAKK
ncbi:MAG: ATP-dependent helicase HrpB [Aestuariibacter sp.]